MNLRRMLRGDVVLATFPFTDLTSSKVRPALVVSEEMIGDDVVLVAISSVVRANQFDTDLLLDSRHPDFSSSGLLRTSVIRTHHIATVQDQIITRVLGHLASGWLNEVDQRLRVALGLSDK